MNIKWDTRFLGLAEHIAQWSKDPSTKVGAVIVRPDRTIASVGFNGWPRNVVDDYKDRDQKLAATIHAEENAILFCRDQSLERHTLYVTFHPCAACAAKIIQANIRRVIYPLEEYPERWADNFRLADDLFYQAGVISPRGLGTYDQYKEYGA